MGLFMMISSGDGAGQDVVPEDITRGVLRPPTTVYPVLCAWLAGPRKASRPASGFGRRQYRTRIAFVARGCGARKSLPQFPQGYQTALRSEHIIVKPLAGGSCRHPWPGHNPQRMAQPNIDPNDSDAGKYREVRFGVENTYSKRQKEVEEFVNRGIGAAMIQHGEQYLERHKDDVVFIFNPTGSVFYLDESASSIKEIFRLLYHVTG
jgi:hypothetical protein